MESASRRYRRLGCLIASGLALVAMLTMTHPESTALANQQEAPDERVEPVTEQRTAVTISAAALAEASQVEEPEQMDARYEIEAKPRRVLRYLGTYKITGYDICVKCCGKTDGITASGTQATLGRTCAAGPELPFGTVLYIDGIGERVVEDRGNGVTEGCLDILFKNHAECYAITGWYDVYIIEEG